MNPTVLIFRAELLPPSETFVAAQAQALRRFSPCFAGLRLIPVGLPIDPCDTVALTSGDTFSDKLRRRLFLETGAITGNFLRDLQHRRPTLLHAHFAIDAAAALPLQKQLNLPLIVTLHGYDVTSRPEALRRSAAGRVYFRRQSDLFARTRFFVCVSAFIRRHALACGFPEAKLRTLPIGVDLSFFARDPLRSPSRDPIVLFVGRLVEEKGCAHLIRAMAFVQDHHPEAKLLIVGDGPLLEPLRAQVRDSVRPGPGSPRPLNCTFLGTQPPSVVRDLMQRARVLATPSILTAQGKSEGLGMMACEAQAMELPVAGFQATGIAEAVADGETGILVPPGDDRALAEAIITLLDDPALAARLGAAGRRRAETRFSLATQTALLEDLYMEALG